MMPVDGKYQPLTSIKVIALIFTLALTVFEILTFQVFDIENLSRSPSTKVVVIPLGGEYQTL